MNKLLILCLIFFTFNAMAKLPTAIKCEQEVSRLNHKWGSENYWTKRSNELFLSPGKNFGEWIILKIESSGTTLTNYKNSGQIQVHFKNQDCSQKLTVIQADSTRKRQLQNDKKFKKEILNSKGIIYLWSPNMPLSLRGIESASKAAQELGIKLIVLMEKDSKLPAGMNINSEYTRSLDSIELKMRNAFLHFPTVLGFKNGKMINKIKYGYENKDGYKNDFKNILSL